MIAEPLPDCSVAGLAEVLARCNLLDRLDAAAAWCQDKGVESLDDMREVEAEEDFVAALELKELKMKLLLKRIREA